MAGILAEEQKHKVGCAYLPNNKNVVASQNSCGCENWDCEHIVVTPLSTLTTAPYGAVTRMNSAFAGGGVSNFKPHKAFTYIIQKCNRLNVLADLRTDVANECEQIRIANGMSRLVRKHKRRDSVSVEQIQDTSYSLNVFKRNTS